MLASALRTLAYAGRLLRPLTSMPSRPLTDLKTRLKEVDELLAARDAICLAGVGRPTQRRGAAVIAGGTVLLSALFEGFVEELYNLSVDTLYAAYPAADRSLFLSIVTISAS